MGLSFEVLFWVGVGAVIGVLVIVAIVDFSGSVINTECWHATEGMVKQVLDAMDPAVLANGKAISQRMQIRNCAASILFINKQQVTSGGLEELLEGLDQQPGETRSQCPAGAQAYVIAVPYFPETSSWYGVKFWKLSQDGAENVANWYSKNVRFIRPFCRAVPCAECTFTGAEPVRVGDSSGETKEYCVTVQRDSATTYKVTAKQGGACAGSGG